MKPCRFTIGTGEAAEADEGTAKKDLWDMGDKVEHDGVAQSRSPRNAERGQGHDNGIFKDSYFSRRGRRDLPQLPHQ